MDKTPGQSHDSAGTSNAAVRAVRNQLAPEPPAEVAVQRQYIHLINTSDTSEDNTSEDNTSEEENSGDPSAKDWENLAKKRQLALLEALEVNKRQAELIGNLEDKIITLREIIREGLGSYATEDTAIDVNNVSTADERQNTLNSTAEADDTEINIIDDTVDTIDLTESD